MTSEDVLTSIESHLQDNWVDNEIVWDNVPYTPNRGTSFISCRLDEVSAFVKSSNCTQVNGLLTISVYTPKNEGSYLNMRRGDNLLALFNGFSANTLYLLAGRIERAGAEDEWYRSIVYIDYKFDKHF